MGRRHLQGKPGLDGAQGVPMVPTRDCRWGAVELTGGDTHWYSTPWLLSRGRSRKVHTRASSPCSAPSTDKAQHGARPKGKRSRESSSKVTAVHSRSSTQGGFEAEVQRMDTWHRDRTFVVVSLGVLCTLLELFSVFEMIPKFKKLTETGQNKTSGRMIFFFSL